MAGRGAAQRAIGVAAAIAVAAAGCAGAPPRARREVPASSGGETTTAARPTAPTAPRSAAPEPEGETDWRNAYADRPALRTLEGPASYYHDSLAGNSTASGEPYDPHAFTAANRELPFGTVLRVVRVDTGAAVIVRVNDRGPFGRRGRIVDLSRAAAEELDMIRRGVVSVRVEVLELGE